MSTGMSHDHFPNLLIIDDTGDSSNTNNGTLRKSDIGIPNDDPVQSPHWKPSIGLGIVAGKVNRERKRKYSTSTSTAGYGESPPPPTS